MLICKAAIKAVNEYNELIDALKLEGDSLSLKIRLLFRKFKVLRTVKNLEALYRR